jgi:Na+/proline symporter
LVAGLGILGLVFFSGDLNAMGSEVDFEQILPYVINNFVPAGLMGLLLAGLFAAFMSTFDSTINAGAAYMVNDIYKRYINRDARPKIYVYAGYICSALLVLIGISFGFMVGSIDSILKWIVAGLWGGYTAPNFLKWYWWRLNGAGYFSGMLAGIVASLIMPKLLPSVSALNGFPIILAFSAAVSVIASLMTDPEDEEVLKSFYKNVRPWGFWRPVHEMVIQDEPGFERNKKFKRDMSNIIIGLVWQSSQVVIPIYFVIREYRSMWVAIGVLVVTSVILKKTWYDKLEA